jgi:hypothetical protein
MDDLADLRTDVKNILVTQERHTVVLAEHVRRCDLLETSVGLLRTEIAPLKESVVVRAAFGRISVIVIGLLTAGAAMLEIVYRLRGGH